MKVMTSPEFDSLLPEQKFDRRSFLVTSLGAGFAAAGAAGIGPDYYDRCQRAGRRRNQDSGQGRRDARLPRDARKRRALRRRCCVVQEIFGVHEHIQDVCRRFAKAGYFAIAPELYARQGDVVENLKHPEIVDNVVKKVPDAQVMGDLDAAAACAKAAGKARYRAPGHHRLLLGRAHRLDVCRAQPGSQGSGGVVWTAGQVVLSRRQERARRGEGPESSGARALRRRGPGHSGRYGRQDTRRLARREKPGDLIVYPDTPHGFNADYRPSYRKEAADDGWKRLQSWFAVYGVV